jgi:hypothetical protein
MSYGDYFGHFGVHKGVGIVDLSQVELDGGLPARLRIVDVKIGVGLD